MIVARLFLGVVFSLAGINGYVYLLGLEPFIATSPEAMQLFQFDYLLVVEKSLEIICGILLLANRYVSLALVILAPLIANILLLHVFVDHSLLALAIIMAIAYGYLLYHYRMNFRRVLEKWKLGQVHFFELACLFLRCLEKKDNENGCGISMCKK